MKSGQKRTLTQRSPTTAIDVNKKLNTQSSPDSIYTNKMMASLTESSTAPLSDTVTCINYQKKYEKINESDAPSWFKDAFSALSEDVCEMRMALSKVNKYTQQCIDNSTEIVELKKRMCALETSNKQLNDHLVKLDLDNRKNNLILEGLPEKGPNENILEEVSRVFEKYLKITSTDMKLSAVYRLGKPPQLLPYPVTKPRKVMVKFEEKSQCERAWKAKSGLKGTKIIEKSCYHTFT